MGDDDEKKLDRSIGRLEGKVELLTETWQRQDAEATAGRRALYDKVDAMIREVTRLTGRVDTIAADLAALKPSIDTFDQLRNQAIGSKKAIALVWSCVIGLITALTAGLVELVHWITRGPPH